MASRFEERFVAQALPLLERQFLQTVDFLQSDDVDDVRIECFVDLAAGEITARTATVLARVESFGVITGARYNDELFHVNGHRTTEFGQTVFTIVRKVVEEEHTNMFDFNDQQATWHEA